MDKRWIIIGILLLLVGALSGCVGVVGYGHGYGYGYHNYPYSYDYGYHSYPDRHYHHDWDDHYRRW